LNDKIRYPITDEVRYPINATGSIPTNMTQSGSAYGTFTYLGTSAVGYVATQLLVILFTE
jgi:hypothetical protein